MSPEFEILIDRTDELSAAELDELRAMLGLSFPGRYDDTAWRHCLGGRHFRLRYRGRLVSHVSLVPRLLAQGDQPLRGVYGESMATIPELQHRGLGTIVAALATADILLHYDVGAFAASKYGFYERLGWARWPGTTYVRTSDGGRQPARPDRGSVMVLLPANSSVDPSGDLTTDWRDGDIW